MAGYSCPNGHSSTKPDSCSVCGEKISGSAPVYGGTDHHTVATLNISLPETEPCPDCGVPRAPDLGDVCEICGYNFTTGGHGEIPSIPPKPHGTPPARTPVSGGRPGDPTTIISPALVAEALAQTWSVTVSVDPSLRGPESPNPPASIGPRAISLKKPVNLIGRSSESRGVLP